MTGMMRRPIFSLLLFSCAKVARSSCNIGVSTTTLLSPAAPTDPAASTPCATLTGNIALPTSFSGAFELPSLNYLAGHISILDATDLTSFSAPELAYGAIEIARLPSLQTLAFPNLTSSARIYLGGLPELREVDFSAGPDFQHVDIWECSIPTLNIKTVRSSFNIFNASSPHENGSVEIQLEEQIFRNDAVVAFHQYNGVNISLSLPKFREASMVEIKGSVVDISMPEFQKAEKDLVIQETAIEELELPKLAEVGRGFMVVHNDRLKSVHMPALRESGYFDFAELSSLEEVQFPELREVHGTLNVSGGAFSAEMPELESVEGGLQLFSAGGLNCTTFDHYNDIDIIRGSYTCEGSHDPWLRPNPSPTADSNTQSTGTSGSSGSSLSTGAKAGIGVGVAVAGIALIIIGAILMKRRARKRQERKNRMSVKAEIPDSPLEVHGRDVKAELGNGREAQEMDAGRAAGDSRWRIRI